MDGYAFEFEFLSELVFDKADVAEVEEAFLVYEEDEGGGFYGGLGGVENFCEFTFLA